MDIDEDHIRLVTSKIKNGKIEIINSEDIKIKCNLYENEQNQNLKPIRNSIKEYINLNKIKIKNVACTTQNENIIFRNIEKLNKNAFLIKTVRGSGYRFEDKI